jgi:hypothetical protein
VIGVDPSDRGGPGHHQRGDRDLLLLPPHLRLRGSTSGTTWTMAGRSSGCRSGTGGATSTSTTEPPGEVKNQITSGDWVVRRGAGGRGGAADLVRGQRDERRAGPLLRPLLPGQLRRDGLTRLTQATGRTTISLLPRRAEYYVVTGPGGPAPGHRARRTSDHAEVVAELGRGDHSALLAAGWIPPEVFTWPRARRGDRHLGDHRAPLHLRPLPQLPGHRVHLRGAPRQPRAQGLQRLPMTRGMLPRPSWASWWS